MKHLKAFQVITYCFIFCTIIIKIKNKIERSNFLHYIRRKLKLISLMPKLSILLSSLFVSWIVKTLSYPNITCGKHFLFANMETCLKLERKIDIWIDG